MLRRCVVRCIRQYREDLGVKATTIIVGCILVAAVTGDITGAALALCLALGGVSDVTVGLSACIAKCMKTGGDDSMRMG